MFRNFLTEKLVTTVISKVSEGDVHGLLPTIKKTAIWLLIATISIIILIIVCLFIFFNFLFSTFSSDEQMVTGETTEAAIVSNSQSTPSEINLTDIANSFIAETEALIPSNIISAIITDFIESIKTFFNLEV